MKSLQPGRLKRMTAIRLHLNTPKIGTEQKFGLSTEDVSGSRYSDTFPMTLKSVWMLHPQSVRSLCDPQIAPKTRSCMCFARVRDPENNCLRNINRRLPWQKNNDSVKKAYSNTKP